MWKALFESNGLLDLPVLVMLFFIAVFAAVVWRACSRKRSGYYAAMSQLPLAEEDQ